MVGEWPGLAASMEGTTTWTPFRQELAAPAGALGINVLASVFKTAGTFCVRQVYIKAYDKNGNLLQPAGGRECRTIPAVGYR